MVFREKIEQIMTNASLSEDERNLLVEKLVPYVLSQKAILALSETDKDLEQIIKKIKESDQEKAFIELLNEKSKKEGVDDTPTDMINDDVSICG